MKIVAILPVRNEDWVLALSLRALLMWVDEVVVLDHASTDITPEIIAAVADEHPGRCLRLGDSSHEWREMAQRQQLLADARCLGATHVVTIDADEVLSGNLLPYIRTLVEHVPPGTVMQLPWLCLRGSIDKVHTTGTWGNQWASSAFRDDPAWHWAARDGYEHHHRHPMGKPFHPWKPVQDRSGGVMHLQFVSDRRLRAKQCLYSMNEVLRWPGKRTPEAINDMYSYAVYGEIRTRGEQRFGTMAQVPPSWWQPYTHLVKYLDVDSEPWQLGECKRLLAEHGAARFQGLDLFGLDK